MFKLTAKDRPLALRLRAEGADGLRVFIGPSWEDYDLASGSFMHAEARLRGQSSERQSGRETACRIRAS